MSIIRQVIDFCTMDRWVYEQKYKTKSIPSSYRVGGASSSDSSNRDTSGSRSSARDAVGSGHTVDRDGAHSVQGGRGEISKDGDRGSVGTGYHADYNSDSGRTTISDSTGRTVGHIDSSGNYSDHSPDPP